MTTSYNQAATRAFDSRPISAPIDLDAILIKAFADYGDDHGWGNGGAHVSDLVGLCDREVWARRSAAGADPGPAREPLATEAALGMELGHIAEGVMLDRMEKHLPEGWTMLRQVPVWLTIDPDGHLFTHISPPGEIVEPAWARDYPPNRWAVGHIDAWLIGPGGTAVFDAKSTVWWNKNDRGKQVWYPKDDIGKPAHRLQVATYALGIGATLGAGLYELDLGGKGRRAVWFDPEDFRDLATRRLVEVLNNTDPANEEPIVMPNEWTFIEATRGQDGRITGGKSWACGYIDRNGNVKQGYCRHTTCDRHIASAEAGF